MEAKLIGSYFKKKGAQQKVKIAVAQGDGIMPEIMEKTLKTLGAAGVNIKQDFIDNEKI